MLSSLTSNAALHVILCLQLVQLHALYLLGKTYSSFLLEQGTASAFKLQPIVHVNKMLAADKDIVPRTTASPAIRGHAYLLNGIFDRLRYWAQQHPTGAFIPGQDYQGCFPQEGQQLQKEGYAYLDERSDHGRQCSERICRPPLYPGQQALTMCNNWCFPRSSLPSKLMV